MPDLIPLGPRWQDRLLARFHMTGWRGFTRLHHLLKPAGGRREIQVRTRYGSQFLLTPWDCIDRHVLTEGFYESEVLKALRPSLSAPDAVLWVVGANFGLHAVTAKILHPGARVLAFEPSPAMGARLLENSRLNSVEVELHAYALAEADAILPFHANDSGNPGMSTLHPAPGFRYAPPFHVATVAAATLLARGVVPPPTVLLVDAEGAEEEVLRGFGSYLSSPTLRSVVFEAANEFLEPGASGTLRDLVTQAGFALVRLERREDTAHALSNFHAMRP